MPTKLKRVAIAVPDLARRAVCTTFATTLPIFGRHALVESDEGADSWRLRTQYRRALAARGVLGSEGFCGRSNSKQWQRRQCQSKFCRQRPKLENYALPQLGRRRRPVPKARP
jgi:hypothetical protein